MLFLLVLHFSFRYLWSKNISTEGKTHVIADRHSIAIGEHNKKILESHINVQKQPLQLVYQKTVVKTFAIFMVKNLSRGLFLMKLFQHRYFPVCERLLMNVVLNSNEEQLFHVKLDEIGVRYYFLCLFVSFLYYYICILSRSSRTEVLFKKLFLKIS